MVNRKSDSDTLLPAVHGIRMVFLVLDATFTTLVQPHPLRMPLYMQHAGKSYAHAQCTQK